MKASHARRVRGRAAIGRHDEDPTAFGYGCAIASTKAPPGESWRVPGREFAPGPGRSDDASMIELNVGAMQKNPASVPACGAKSSRLPAGVPISVAVAKAPPFGPNAPPLRC